MKPPGKKSNRTELRSSARLAATQALYQMEVADKGLNDILAEFETYWIGQEIEGDAYKPAEVAFFRDVVSGVLGEQGPIDRGVDAVLEKGWPLRRIEALMRAILRAAYYELRSRPDVPARVVVTEYVDVAAAFFGQDEVGMVNAVLDALARETRPAEFAADSP
jgi:transcription antitermination protein NusB